MKKPDFEIQEILNFTESLLGTATGSWIKYVSIDRSSLSGIVRGPGFCVELRSQDGAIFTEARVRP